MSGCGWALHVPHRRPCPWRRCCARAAGAAVPAQQWRVWHAVRGTADAAPSRADCTRAPASRCMPARSSVAHKLCWYRAAAHVPPSQDRRRRRARQTGTRCGRCRRRRAGQASTDSRTARARRARIQPASQAAVPAPVPSAPPQARAQPLQPPSVTAAWAGWRWMGLRHTLGTGDAHAPWVVDDGCG